MSYTAGTFNLKHGDVVKNVIHIDATGLVVGRLAAEVAKIIRGKHKPSYTPHIDCGDMVIITNADKVVLTKNKATQSKFYWHTGYVGGIKEITPAKTFARGHPERVLERAILRMLPKESPLATKQFKNNLRVYASDTHPHDAQKPVMLDISVRNKKNKR